MEVDYTAEYPNKEKLLDRLELEDPETITLYDLAVCVQENRLRSRSFLDWLIANRVNKAELENERFMVEVAVNRRWYGETTLLVPYKHAQHVLGALLQFGRDSLEYVRTLYAAKGVLPNLEYLYECNIFERDIIRWVNEIAK